MLSAFDTILNLHICSAVTALRRSNHGIHSDTLAVVPISIVLQGIKDNCHGN